MLKVNSYKECEERLYKLLSKGYLEKFKQDFEALFLFFLKRKNTYLCDCILNTFEKDISKVSYFNLKLQSLFLSKNILEIKSFVNELYIYTETNFKTDSKHYHKNQKDFNNIKDTLTRVLESTNDIDIIQSIFKLELIAGSNDFYHIQKFLPIYLIYNGLDEIALYCCYKIFQYGSSKTELLDVFKIFKKNLSKEVLRKKDIKKVWGTVE